MNARSRRETLALRRATRRNYIIVAERKRSSDCIMAAHCGDDQAGAVLYAVAEYFEEATQ